MPALRQGVTTSLPTPAWYITELLVELTPKGLVFLSFSTQCQFTMLKPGQRCCSLSQPKCLQAPASYMSNGNTRSGTTAYAAAPNQNSHTLCRQVSTADPVLTHHASRPSACTVRIMSTDQQAAATGLKNGQTACQNISLRVTRSCCP